MNDTEIDYEASLQRTREILGRFYASLLYSTPLYISWPRCRFERKNILTDSYLTEEE